MGYRALRQRAKALAEMEQGMSFSEIMLRRRDARGWTKMKAIYGEPSLYRILFVFCSLSLSQLPDSIPFHRA